MKEFISILVERDGVTEREAKLEIMDFRRRMLAGEFNDVEYEFTARFGLEPDFLMDIM